jgi:hypothetical protein
MPAIISFPFDFLRFWFFQAPKELVLYFLSLNKAFLQLFSLGLLLRTFFKPIKNEYRNGLVGFSIGMGIFVKTWIILFDTALLLLLTAFELVFVIAFVLWPFATIALLLV